MTRLVQSIERLHGGQLAIVWLLLIIASPAFALWAFSADAATNRHAQDEVDRAPRPTVTIEGIQFPSDSGEASLFKKYLTETGQLGASAGSADERFREYLAEVALLKRGEAPAAAREHAHRLASVTYYDSTRAYYDGIRASYRQKHLAASVLPDFFWLCSGAAPLFGLAVTWIWLGGRARKNRQVSDNA